MNGKKWYSYEDGFTRKGVDACNALREHLIENDIPYEVSGVENGYHFEIYTDAAGAAALNGFIDAWYAAHDVRTFYNEPARA